MSGPATREDLDGLRRRLYREGASPEDLERYAEALAADPGTPMVASPAGSDRRPPTSGRRWLPVAALAGVLVLAVGAGAFAGRAFPHPLATPDARAAAVTAVAAPRYFNERLEPLPAEYTSTVEPDTQVFTGRGSGTVVIDPATLSFSGGHVEVTMTSATTAPVGWEVTRIDTRQDWSFFSTVLAQRSAVQNEGVPIPAAFSWEGTPPMYVRVQAAPTVRWGLLLDFGR